MKLDENRLVAQLKQGREDAYRLLIRRYQPMVFRLAFGMTLDREESLNIVQEVFLTVHRSISRFQQKSKLSTWLHRITVNRCLNWKRTWKRHLHWHHESFDEQQHADILDTDAGKLVTENRYMVKELGRRIQEGLSKLPDDARTVFVLKEIEGLSYDQIAETLNIRRGTVSSRLFYARKRLRELLGDLKDGA